LEEQDGVIMVPGGSRTRFAIWSWNSERAPLFAC